MKNNLLKRAIGVGALFFLTAVNAQDTEGIIRNYINTDASFKGATEVLDFKILNENNSVSLKANIVDVQQYYKGIPVYKSLAKAVIRDGEIVTFKNNFERKVVVSKYNQTNNVAAAFDAALSDLKIANSSQFTLIKDKSQPDGDKQHVVNKLFYYQNNNKLVPAQLFFIDDSANNAFWAILVNLENNQIIEKENMVISCSFDHNHEEDFSAASTSELVSTLQKAQLNNSNNASAALDASYNVFKLPVEAPTFGARTIVTNPWDLSASPLGWHATNTNTYTYTRGNNVHAYFDNRGNNSAPSTDLTDGGSNMSFDFPYSEGVNVSAYDSKHAAITNLFYLNNMMHDIFYKFGFTETARNYQTHNFDLGGVGSDAVRAEAYDGSGYNNANFSSGYELLSGEVLAPRMQMFLWKSGALGVQQKVFYNAPNDAVSRPPVNAGAANFGKQVMSIPVTGNVAIPTVVSACSAIPIGELSGKIAIVPHSGCAFNIKVKNAQNAGAIGVIVHRTNSNTPQNMSNTNNGTTGISIPTIMIGKDEGDYILEQINNTVAVNVTLKDLGNGYKNSSFDNGIIAHEYGHGISNRLTGQGYNCLGNSEQMGEGWSDFFGLMITNKPDYTASTPRGMATYSAGQDVTGGGIRGRKYSPDMAINNYTYNSIVGATSPHAVGQVWATILWDLHWKLADKYGFSHDLVNNPTSGSAKTMQLVMDGLKLQPCSPDFVSGRDAILQADALTGGVDECDIWEVFARRGVGVDASAGSSNSIGDQIESFDVPLECKLSTNDLVKNKAYSIYPNPAKGEFFITGKPTISLDTVKVEIMDVSGKVVKTIERKKNSRDAISTKGLIKGVYIVSIVDGGKILQADKLIVE